MSTAAVRPPIVVAKMQRLLAAHGDQTQGALRSIVVEGEKARIEESSQHCRV
jgi:hypothetical protein